MENNDQITALAREYAEECTNPSGFSKATYEEMVEERAENVTYVLRWLLRRYCLVEKGKAEKEYHEAKFACGNIDPCSDTDTWIRYHTEKSLLERIFPNLGKEVEK